MKMQFFKSQIQYFSWYNTLKLKNENTSSFNLLDGKKIFIYLFLKSNTIGSIEKMSNFWIFIVLPTFKPTMKNISSFDFVSTSIIQLNDFY